MIKYIIPAFVAICLISCTQVNTTGDKTITQGDDTLAEVDISLSKMDAVEELSNIEEVDKVLFKANGSEPGWFAEISETKIKFVFDYGKDSLIMENQGEVINDKKDYKYIVQDKNINKQISIEALNKPCTSASGDKADRQVNVSYKGKKYIGCGSFIK